MIPVGLTGTEFKGGLLLAVVNIDGDDLGAVLGFGTLQDRQTDTTNTENGNVGVFYSAMER